jgi:hypothetical protein
VDRDRFHFFILISVFFHCGIIMLFYQYGLPVEEEPERRVPVEVMLIRDIPLASIITPEAASEPKALIGRPSPIITGHKLTMEVSGPALLEEPLIPQLEVANVPTKRSLSEVRDAKAAPARRMTNLKRGVNITSAIDSLPPEQDPAIELETTKGLITISASERSIPAPSAQALVRSETLQMAEDSAEISLGKTASLGPRLLAPDDEPASLKMERPPTIPFPGSTKGASFMLLVDTSGSVKGNPLKGIKTSAIEFISLMGPKDRVALMIFNDKTQLVTDFTAKNERLKYRIRSLRTAGKNTVLNDSLLEAGQILITEDREKLHIVLFSDGKDEGSQASLAQVIRKLKKAKISVLAVGYTRVEKKYLVILRNIADGTGGVFIQTPEFQDILSLYKATAPVSEASPQKAEPDGSALLVNSNPPDARIYVNGEFLGATPMLIKLPMGKYHVQLQSDGYNDWQAQIELDEPGELPLYINLHPIQ